MYSISVDFVREPIFVSRTPKLSNIFYGEGTEEGWPMEKDMGNELPVFNYFRLQGKYRKQYFQKTKITISLAHHAFVSMCVCVCVCVPGTVLSNGIKWHKYDWQEKTRWHEENVAETCKQSYAEMEKARKRQQHTHTEKKLKQ